MNLSIPFRTHIGKILVAFLILASCVAFAQVPHKLNYQGYLTNPSGAAVNAVTLTITFKLYASASGGTELYSETQTVTPSNGIFNVLIGNATALTLPFDQPYFVGVTVGADTEMTPRQPLAASPYAIRSASTESLAPGLIVGPSNLPPTQVLPTAGCATNQIPKWNGSAWACAADAVGGGSAFQWQNVTVASQQALPNTGYATFSPSQTSITLPTSPAVGDTIRIASASAGGWRLAQNANQSVSTAPLGPAGFVGNTWAPRERARNWHRIASSADGTKLLAAENPGLLHTSTDSGNTWTSRGTSRSWTALASSADGNKLIAATFNDQIYTSTDSGVSWTPRETNREWKGVASSADGVKLVAAAKNTQLYTSNDAGVTWIPRETARNWDRVASSADGVKLVANVINGQLYTSTDSGVTWVARDSVRGWLNVASSVDGTKLVAAAFPGNLYTSTDSGVTWTPRDAVRFWNGVSSSADGNRLLATENASISGAATGGQIYVSSDAGVTWTARESSRFWNDVAVSGDGTKFFAVASGPDNIYLGFPGTTVPGIFGYLSGAPSASIELLYIGNNQFLPISFTGTVVQ